MMVEMENKDGIEVGKVFFSKQYIKETKVAISHDITNLGSPNSLF